MPVRAFDDDARLATQQALPVPRGIAFHLRSTGGGAASVSEAENSVAATLTGWKITAIEGLPGWFEAVPEVATMSGQIAGATTPAPPDLGNFWVQLQELRSLPDVDEADPLFLISTPEPPVDATQNPFAMPYGVDGRALWGRPYDSETSARKQQRERDPQWHLTQINMNAARSRWDARHPGKLPGDGIIVAHPDTGYTDHPELSGRVSPNGRSFLRDRNGNDEVDARDTLRGDDNLVPDQPGHGTATGSIIVSGTNDPVAPGVNQVFGVAPGATLLPLRVSRSVIHFDFSNVGRAILYAIEQGADVISMSLGGPLHSSFVQRCIREARANGIIVVSAAGNQIPTTVFPAAFPEVIAVAATHAADGPWNQSGLGPLVDIAAPGQGVWCARASLNGSAITFSSSPGTGTSFATANVAGLAALWLAYHGGRAEIAKHYGNNLALVPVAFQYLLEQTASSNFPFVERGRHGAGIANAGELLEIDDFPSKRKVEDFEKQLKKQGANKITFLTGLFSGWRGITEDIEEPAEPMDLAARRELAEREQAETARLLERLIGKAASKDELLVDELTTLIAADRPLLVGLSRWRDGDSLLPIYDRMIGVPDNQQQRTSPALRERLEAQRKSERKRLEPMHRGTLRPPEPMSVTRDAPAGTYDTPATPGWRPLRSYAFDPSLETKLDTAAINQVTIPTRWEHLQPGPIGEYLEVVDIDPASGCVYAPVDLNHPHILAQSGLPPSEGNPQFHQQMVYAVAMNTIHRFELALGRPIFWSPIRPWLRMGSGFAERDYYTPEARAMIDEQLDNGWPNDTDDMHLRDRYVQRLRIYPHALREKNAYYSPEKRALLFGYFPAIEDDAGKHYPGGTVFTCLSQDIVTHEMTHALLDGMHSYFNEPTNPDVWAFHEAFADIMALFQHFTFPEALRQQIARSRGDLRNGSMLGELAQQFGQTTSGRRALRSYLGEEDEEGGWVRIQPRPDELRTTLEPHDRGKILVAAVFDAFLNIYNYRTADLIRIATGGTGVLQAGQIHPDLVNRLANEAAAAAEEILRVCIRALDYVPPVDITFGEFLRALITADYDLAPTERRNRIAFIDAFRSWGIYPRNVRTLSEDTLRWHRPDADSPLTNMTRVRMQGGGEVGFYTDQFERSLTKLAPALDAWQPLRSSTSPTTADSRRSIFDAIQQSQAILHNVLSEMHEYAGREVLPGLDLRKDARFSVSNLRPARRIGLQGEFHNEMVFEVVQSRRRPDAPEGSAPFRGGATVVVDMRDWEIRYIIYKRLYEQLPEDAGDPGAFTDRANRQLRFASMQRLGAAGDAQEIWRGEDSADLTGWHTATYSSTNDLARRTAASHREPFAFLHRSLD